MLKPLGKRLLLQREQEVAETSKLIILDKSPKKLSNEAVVVDIGHEVKHIFKGDKVLWAEYTGRELQHDGQEFVMVSEDDVIGIILNG